MGEESKIEWCHHTFNPWWGCQKVSAGCKNCYALDLDHRWGGDHWGPEASRKMMSEAHWKKPLAWNKKAAAAGQRHRVFCASMADVFEIHPDPEENAKLDDARLRLWRLIEKTPHLDWLLLTKRPENHHLAPAFWNRLPPKNVWLGTTAENQEQADLRIPHLLAPSWPSIRFVSYEPALEQISLFRYLHILRRDATRRVDWVIAGAESGPRAREMRENWIRAVRQECDTAGVPFFYKQRVKNGFKISLPLLDGVRYAEFPKT